MLAGAEAGRRGEGCLLRILGTDGSSGVRGYGQGEAASGRTAGLAEAKVLGAWRLATGRVGEERRGSGRVAGAAGGATAYTLEVVQDSESG